MATENVYKSELAHNVEIDISSGEVIVEATDEVDFVDVRVRTADDEGPSADAVNNAKFREYSNNTLGIRIKSSASANAGTVITGGSGVVFRNLSGPVSIVGGRVYSGGVEITADGRGAATPDPASRPVQVIVRLPRNRDLVVNTQTASVLAEGLYCRADVETVSGSVEVEEVFDLTAETVSGAITITKVADKGRLKSVSGSIKVREWAGDGILQLSSVSGSVKVSSATRATGPIVTKTVSGSTRLRGTSHLDVRMSSVSGSKDRT